MQPPPVADLQLRTEVSTEEDGGFVPIWRSRLLENGLVHLVTAWNPGDRGVSFHR